jgi:predicted aspartyl protease
MSHSYNTDYFPPIPVLTVTFGYGGERPWLGPFEVIVDTGADATIVPEDIPLQLKAIPLNPAQIKTQWGDIHSVTMFLLDIQIGDQHLGGIVTAGAPESDEIILGRNVLNKLPLFLDGPRQQSEVLDDATVRRLRARSQRRNE